MKLISSAKRTFPSNPILKSFARHHASSYSAGRFYSRESTNSITPINEVKVNSYKCEITSFVLSFHIESNQFIYDVVAFRCCWNCCEGRVAFHASFSKAKLVEAEAKLVRSKPSLSGWQDLLPFEGWHGNSNQSILSCSEHLRIFWKLFSQSTASN